MAQKSWQLNRRTFLRGAGIACALPYLDAMSFAAPSTEKPARLCYVYFPNGCSLPEENDEKNNKWRWFPNGEGKEFQFTKVLESLEPYRNDLTILGGLSHPKSRELLGHLAGDTWLTGGEVRGALYQNTISADQVAALQFKRHTRYPSLVFSGDGGVGYKSRVSTLSFDTNGRAIPSEHKPRRIFERYFSPDGGATSEERRRSLQEGKKVVDLVLEDSKRLHGKLGKDDKEKMEEYLTSLNSVEEQIRRNEKWLDTPLKPFDAKHLMLDPDPKVDPQAMLRSIFDLIVLGFQIDLTRVMTYMLGREDGMGVYDHYPRLALGIQRGHHTISHDAHEGHWDQWGPFDQWVAQQFAYFVGRMKAVRDEHGPLLDNTQILYGACCSTTHNARNYPLALVGGRSLGLKHGQYLRYDESTPFSNVLLTMLQTAGVKAETFSDATGPLPELLV